MAITVRDRHGTYGRKRKAEGPKLDAKTARYFAVVGGSWSRGYATKKEADRAERAMKDAADRGVNLVSASMTFRDFFERVWWPSVETRQKRDDIAIGTALHYSVMAKSYLLP